jgi:hypothetical protein
VQGERDRLLSSLNSVAGKNDTENSKLKENYRNKIKTLEEQVRSQPRDKDVKSKALGILRMSL